MYSQLRIKRYEPGESNCVSCMTKLYLRARLEEKEENGHHNIRSRYNLIGLPRSNGTLSSPRDREAIKLPDGLPESGLVTGGNWWPVRLCRRSKRVAPSISSWKPFEARFGSYMVPPRDAPLHRQRLIQ